MPTTPPYRYGSLEARVANRLDTLEEGAPVEFDTLREIATELQQMRSELDALHHEHLNLSLIHI